MWSTQILLSTELRWYAERGLFAVVLLRRQNSFEEASMQYQLPYAVAVSGRASSRSPQIVLEAVSQLEEQNQMLKNKPSLQINLPRQWSDWSHPC